MFRYVAFVWDDADSEASAGARSLAQRLRAASPGWEAALEHGGLQVFCADVRPGSSEIYRLHGDGGVVLGRLFNRGRDSESTSAPLALAETETHGILRSAGRRLMDRYWGRYVAFLREAGSPRTTWVLRDPTSALPCFTTRLLGVDVYFSHMEEASLLGGQAFSINWRYVAAALCQNRLNVHATGLNEVSQLLGGECVTVSRGQTSRQFYWNALDVAASEPLDDVTEAARELRRQTQDCVRAWVSGHDSILHLLSGGLDSSIVLSCLRVSLTPRARQLTCLNFHSPGSNTDERGYARLAATGIDCEVVERPRNSVISLEGLLQIRRTCIPGDNFFYLGDSRRVEAELAVQKGATTVLSGYGGDQLFYQSRARYAAADYFSRHGIRSALFSVALDAARVDRLSIWSVLGETLRHGVLRQRWSQRDEVGDRRPLLRADVVRDISRDENLLHPWLQAPGRLSSGKIWHAYQLLFPFEFYNPLGADGDPEPATPLFSQPLMELSLRIPTWVLTVGGWDRALARRAFQHDVPRSIVTRRSKGGQEEHAKSILARNLGFARELLQEGLLVREGILDKDRVVDVLSGRPSRTASSNVELFACLSVEAWLRQWQAA